MLLSLGDNISILVATILNFYIELYYGVPTGAQPPGGFEGGPAWGPLVNIFAYVSIYIIS